MAAVACAGLIGIAATWFDATIDIAVRDRLEALKESPLIRRSGRRRACRSTTWGRGSAGAAIACDLPGTTSAARSRRCDRSWRRPGSGATRGTTAGGSRTWPARRRSGSRTPAETLGEALTLWGKHLVADVVTPMSLPLPGWTRLYELPSRGLRTFADQAYDNGLNIRWAALSTLPVLTTEVVVRTHVHGRAMLARGTATWNPPRPHNAASCCWPGTRSSARHRWARR